MKKGFTLIELLVVIAIIGILTTLSLVGFGNIQAKSRDSQRKSDLSKIATAMELYKTDKKSYPKTVAMDPTTCTVTGTTPLWLDAADPCFSKFLTQGNYTSSIPINPKGDPYMIKSNGITYKVLVTSETLSGDPDADPKEAGEYYNVNGSKCLQVSPDALGYAFDYPTGYCL